MGLLQQESSLYADSYHHLLAQSPRSSALFTLASAWVGLQGKAVPILHSADFYHYPGPTLPMPMTLLGDN